MALNKQTLSEQIYQELRADILHHRIPSGTKLTLKYLKEKFEVSSTPIREALTRLTEEQLVSYYSNIGVNVVDFAEKDIIEIFEFMGDLDSLAVQYASDSDSHNKIVKELKQNITASSSVIASVEDWIGYSDDFHLIFYKYCNNTRLTRSAGKLRCQLSVAAYRYENELLIRQSIQKEHEQIYEAFANKDYSQAALLMKKHLTQSMHYALKMA